MGIVGGDLDALNRHHSNPRVFELASDQLGQITLDLVGHLEAPVGRTGFFAHSSAQARLQGSGNFANFIKFQHVTFLDVVVIFDVQAAFEALFDLSGIVLESLE